MARSLRRAGMFGMLLLLVTPAAAAQAFDKADTTQAVNACIEGTPASGWCGDGGPALRARLASPGSIVALPDGGFAFVDRLNQAIRAVDARGTIRTVVRIRGEPEWHCALAQVALAPGPQLIVASPNCGSVYSVTLAGRVRTLVGHGRLLFPVSDALRPMLTTRHPTSIGLSFPQGVTVTRQGTVFIADDSELRRLDPSGRLTTQPLFPDARFASLAMSRSGALLLNGEGIVWRRQRNGRLVPLAGTARGPLGANVGLVALPDGRVLVPDFAGSQVLAIGRDGQVRRFAGDGRAGLGGDGGPATAAHLSEPNGIAAQPDGGILVTDAGNERIRLIRPDGRIATVAGSGRPTTNTINNADRSDGDGCLRDGCGGTDYQPLYNYLYFTHLPIRGTAGKTLTLHIVSSRRSSVTISVWRRGTVRRYVTYRRIGAGRSVVVLRRRWTRGRYVIQMAAPSDDDLGQMDRATARIR